MGREPIATWCFSLVVVRRDDDYLLVHERKQDQRWYLPAGRVEPGESFIEAACRETLEEGGIPIRVTGVIRVEHSPAKSGARLRVIFLGEPIDATPPKSWADAESLEARWVKFRDLNTYRLRSDEVRDIIGYVHNGGQICPLSILQPEGNPY